MTRKPVEEGGEARGRHAYRRVGSAVVDAQRVTVVAEQPATRKNDVVDVAGGALVRLVRAEDPFIRAGEQPVRPFGVEKRKSEPVDRAGGCDPDAVVEDEPPLRGEQRRRVDPDLVRVPPRALASADEHRRVAPVAEV